MLVGRFLQSCAPATVSGAVAGDAFDESPPGETGRRAIGGRSLADRSGPAPTNSISKAPRRSDGTAVANDIGAGSGAEGSSTVDVGMCERRGTNRPRYAGSAVTGTVQLGKEPGRNHTVAATTPRPNDQIDSAIDEATRNRVGMRVDDSRRRGALKGASCARSVRTGGGHGDGSHSTPLT